MIKNYLKNISGLILFIALSFSAPASGFLGGEISLKHYTGSTYIVKFVAYKDCNSCQVPSQVNVSYICLSNSLFTFSGTASAATNMIHDITHACPASPTHCGNGSNPGVKSAVFLDTVSLPPGSWDIRFYASYGTRVSYTNAPGQGGWFMHCEINNSQGTLPYISYSNYPPFIFALNQTAGIDYSANAPAGDSLVYSFYHPYKTATTHITYSGSYSASSFINSSTPISLDSTTGFLSFTPLNFGSFIVGVKCEQYHKINGIYSKIGTFYRESVIFVKITNTHTPEITISGANAVISGNKILYCKTDTPLNVMLLIQVSDLDSISPYNKVFIKYADSLPGSSFLTYNNGDSNATALLYWQPTAADIQKTHHFTITLSDSACPYNLIRSYPFQIKFEDPPPAFDLGNDTTLLNNQVLFLKLPHADSYLWSTGDTTQILTVAELFNYSNPIKGSIFNSAGCSTSDSINVMFNYVGLEQIAGENCKLYPNPNNGQFYLELKAEGKQQYRILIFDALGREVYNTQMEFEDYGKMEIDLGNNPAGVYQIKLISQKDIINRSLIIH